MQNKIKQHKHRTLYAIKRSNKAVRNKRFIMGVIEYARYLYE